MTIRLKETLEVGSWGPESGLLLGAHKVRGQAPDPPSRLLLCVSVSHSTASSKAVLEPQTGKGRPAVGVIAESLRGRGGDSLPCSLHSY